MADVTGGYPGGPTDENWTRRGSAAGKFKPPGTVDRVSQAQGMVSELLDQIKQGLGFSNPLQLKVTGDVGTSSVDPTYSGGGRNSGSGSGRVTIGATGGVPNVPSGPDPTRGGVFRNAAGEIRPGFGRAAFVGGMMPGVLTAGSELQANRPLAAAAALGTGAVTSGLGTLLLKTRNPLAMAVGGGLMLAGAPLSGMAANAAEGAKQGITNVPTTGKENEFGTQMAIAKKQAELETNIYRTNLGLQTSQIRDLQKYASDLQYLDLQRSMPLVNQMKNADLIRQQSLLASQGQQLGNLSVLETAGQLATGGQAQTGETIRTMLTSNPYANAVLR